MEITTIDNTEKALQILKEYRNSLLRIRLKMQKNSAGLKHAQEQALLKRFRKQIQAPTDHAES